jgi:RNA polymerase sigma-70 factor (ECF subfamily)
MYQPRIYRFIYLKVNHREEAEDLSHQVFLSSWQNISSFTQQGFPISSWFYQIACNRVIDYYRTKHTTIPLEDMQEEIHTTIENIADTVESKMQLENIYTALRSLHPDQQDIIIMRFVEELSSTQTARALGKNKGTLRVLQYRALRELKKQMQKQQKNNEDSR